MNEFSNRQSMLHLLGNPSRMAQGIQPEWPSIGQENMGKWANPMAFIMNAVQSIREAQLLREETGRHQARHDAEMRLAALKEKALQAELDERPGLFEHKKAAALEELLGAKAKRMLTEKNAEFYPKEIEAKLQQMASHSAFQEKQLAQHAAQAAQELGFRREESKAHSSRAERELAHKIEMYNRERGDGAGAIDELYSVLGDESLADPQRGQKLLQMAHNLNATAATSKKGAQIQRVMKSVLAEYAATSKTPSLKKQILAIVNPSDIKSDEGKKSSSWQARLRE